MTIYFAVFFRCCPGQKRTCVGAGPSADRAVAVFLQSLTEKSVFLVAADQFVETYSRLNLRLLPGTMPVSGFITTNRLPQWWGVLLRVFDSRIYFAFPDAWDFDHNVRLPVDTRVRT
jgi:hypothetical protein